eukprot:CAMPEP_0181082040 /NCGR_PEP_ID=MMETSP1071-20121207/3413_1 /TAXON_ID=35127 /ORGANISM="Thalassiosira sp., Strain NH16" /LENGTH=433 /DNA_ID=CAMNT_0023163607 /DNA_START=149 /DNA_END=1447 /DNA_ORIENTATION=-
MRDGTILRRRRHVASSSFPFLSSVAIVATTMLLLLPFCPQSDIISRGLATAVDAVELVGARDYAVRRGSKWNVNNLHGRSGSSSHHRCRRRRLTGYSHSSSECRTAYHPRATAASIAAAATSSGFCFSATATTKYSRHHHSNDSYRPSIANVGLRHEARRRMTSSPLFSANLEEGGGANDDDSRINRPPRPVNDEERGVANTGTNNNIDDDTTNDGWTSRTLSIAVPALAGMMTDPILSMVDTLFVARLGGVPLAALGACTSIFHLAFHCFRATTGSVSSLVAAAIVRDDSEKQRRKQNERDDDFAKGDEHDDDNCDDRSSEAVLIARTSMEQAVITGSIITAFLLAFGPRCLSAMGVVPIITTGGNNRGGGGELYGSARAYLDSRAIAAPAVVAMTAAEGIFRGHGDVVTPWKVSCTVALLNLALDPFCMFG